MSDEITRLDQRWQTAVYTLEQGDVAGALYLFLAMAKEGEQAAFREIANIYQHGGPGVDVNHQKARDWYVKAIDQADDAHACIGLASLYYSGLSGRADYDSVCTIFSWLKILIFRSGI